jgi:osmotically inducible protein OsmC
MKRKASAVWRGDLKTGSGTISAASGILKDAPYSFKTRFEEPITGTNPDELIAAAHAGCFTMALSAQLANAGHKPDRVSTQATLDLEPGAAGFSITGIHLDTTAKVSGIDDKMFQELALKAKEGCPVSRALSVRITLEAKLER